MPDLLTTRLKNLRKGQIYIGEHVREVVALDCRRQNFNEGVWLRYM